MRAIRCETNPVITRGMHETLGTNINGPSLIRVPDWFPNPLGRYYLYFAHHQGKFIRLACADDVRGPWTIHPPGVFHLDEAPCRGHVASPDVHLDHDTKRMRMYYHGCAEGGQKSYVATSVDGLAFVTEADVLGPFYFRVFEHGGAWYALAKSDPDTTLLRAENPLGPFEAGPHLLDRVRHTALWKRGETLHVFASRIGDAPERILHTTVDLAGDWRGWREGEWEEILRPEREWEGAGEPVIPSRAGSKHEPVNQLRDPCVFLDEGRAWLLYSAAGEQAIALAELRE